LIIIVVNTLNDWRTGFLLFLIWLLFEDLARKYLGNGLIFFFGKDILAAITYASILKAKAKNVGHKLDVRTAENYADEMEWEAGFAVDYAIASVEQATVAVLDAIDSRARAELKKQA